MNEKLTNYLNGIFSPYEDLHGVKDLKEELFIDLNEKLSDLKAQGYDDEAAYRMTVSSLGDVSEIIESITSKTRELQQMIGMDFSKINLQNSDFKDVKVHDGKFNYSALKGSDFSGADLTNSTFKCSDLTNVKFDGANLTGAKIIKSSLKEASFKNCVFDRTDFSSSDLSGICFDNQTFIGTIFDYSGLKRTSFKNAVFKNVSFKTVTKKAIFDGATMDKLTYAVLKGSHANLTNVTVI
ncbi:pentapeptide repeat-containing protein [Fictibacillus sp. Mic-4]|uniref:pentapeptide repeat-containing protein n=1 Tax=Fictibacillus sp. Mic-4 TaxID=3132826 RepID=UPI003CF73813